MNQTVVLLVIYAAVALIVATVFLLLRDLFRRRDAADQQGEGAEKSLDLAALLPPAETVAAGETGESWLEKIVAETRSDFTAETAVLLAILIGLALGGTLFVWRDDLLAGVAGGVVECCLSAGAVFSSLAEAARDSRATSRRHGAYGTGRAGRRVRSIRPLSWPATPRFSPWRPSSATAPAR